MATTIMKEKTLEIGTVVTVLDGTTASYTYQHGDRKVASCIQLGDDCDAVEVIISGTGATNNSCVFSLYGYSRDGPAVRIYKTVTATLGTATAGSGQVWADTILGTDYHLNAVTIADTADDTVCKMLFDTLGMKYLYFELVSLATMTAVKFHVREIGQK